MPLVDCCHCVFESSVLLHSSTDTKPQLPAYHLHDLPSCCPQLQALTRRACTHGQACLCRVCVQCQLCLDILIDARSELSAAGHESLGTSRCPQYNDSLYLKNQGHKRPSARTATPERELGHAVCPGTGTRM